MHVGQVSEKLQLTAIGKNVRQVKLNPAFGGMHGFVIRKLLKKLNKNV